MIESTRRLDTLLLGQSALRELKLLLHRVFNAVQLVPQTHSLVRAEPEGQLARFRVALFLLSEHYLRFRVACAWLRQEL